MNTVATVDGAALLKTYQGLEGDTRWPWFDSLTQDQRQALRAAQDAWNKAQDRIKASQVRSMKRQMKLAGWKSLGGGWVRTPSGGKVQGWTVAMKPILDSIQKMGRGPECCCPSVKATHGIFCPFYGQAK